MDSAKRALDGFRASSIWREVQESEAVYTELPFAISMEGDNAAGVLRGIMDLVFRIPGGWKIVDYKTGYQKTNLRENKNPYWRQIDAYSRHWKMICKENVVEKGLWLVDENRWVTR